MSISASDQFRFKAQQYQINYRRDNDDSKYYANLAATGSSLYLEEYLKKNPTKAIKGLPIALSLSGPVLAGLIDALSDQLKCPVENNLSLDQFMKHLKEKVNSRLDAAYAAPARSALAMAKSGLEEAKTFLSSLGL